MAEVDKYEVLEKIGHGSFGVIRKVRRKLDGHILCRKEISYLKMSSKEREQLHAELSILKTLRHPNIVAYYEREHLKASQDLHIYMEYCECGDLGRRIKELKRYNHWEDEDFVWSVLAQTVSALYRCHYGEDPPEVGRHVMGLSNDAKPALTSKSSHDMILHRDLKPENIFLGADATVKLGDFGLSKIMASHDFASTYVGTPFYMSPEICAAEQYSLHSDIWALGCIMYELCTKEPPFNAKTHLELIQKIRSGRVKPLPTIYSQELSECIMRCLRVNPQSRPDTSQLLNIPMVKLKRKELEIVQLGKQLKLKEEQAARTLKEVEQKLAVTDADRHAVRIELENTVRREWEVKARLEIDRQIQLGMDRIQRTFEVEVSRKVGEELARREAESTTQQVRSSTPNLEDMPPEHLQAYHQSQSTSGETDDFPSSTDLSELSLESPSLERGKMKKRSSRTPFGRAQTMFEGSPMDVTMADPSPAPIGHLGLSPRRTANIPSRLSRNIFAAAENSSIEESESDMQDLDDEDDADIVPNLPSPTRSKMTSADPFKSGRPTLLRQKTAPQGKLGTNAPLFTAPNGTKTGFTTTKDSNNTTKTTKTPLFPKGANTSPNRRLSKLPSASALTGDGGSPARKSAPSTSPTRQTSQTTGRPGSSRGKLNGDEVRHSTLVNSHVQGRTLIELAQARTATRDFAEEDTAPTKHKKVDSIPASKDSSVTLWDPERDEMPSPFLARGNRPILAGHVGGPGLRHLR